MKKTLLIVLALSVPALRAQQPAAGSRTEEQKPAPASQESKPAPQLGHPLDPADVDVLTGKAKNLNARGQRGEVLPYGVGYPINVAQYDARQLGQAGATIGAGLPTEVLLGRSGNRSFLGIGNTPAFLPPPVFFTGRFTGRRFAGRRLPGRVGSGFVFRRR